MVHYMLPWVRSKTYPGQSILPEKKMFFTKAIPSLNTTVARFIPLLDAVIP